MVDTYESLNERFPILDIVIKHLDDAERVLLKELFLTVYRVGYRDGKAKPITTFPTQTAKLEED